MLSQYCRINYVHLLAINSPDEYDRFMNNAAVFLIDPGLGLKGKIIRMTSQSGLMEVY